MDEMQEQETNTDPSFMEKVTGALTTGAATFPTAFYITHSPIAAGVATVFASACGTIYGDAISHTLSQALFGIDRLSSRIRNRESHEHLASDEQKKVLAELCEIAGFGIPEDLDTWTYEEVKQTIGDLQIKIERAEQQELEEAEAEANRQVRLLQSQRTHGQAVSTVETDEADFEEYLSTVPTQKSFPIGEKRQQIEQAAPRQKPVQYQQQPQPKRQAGSEICLGVNRKNNTPVVINVNNLFGLGLFAAGAQESGKSTFMAMLSEQFATLKVGNGYGIPTLLVDYKDEYRSLASYLDYGLVAGSPTLQKDRPEKYYPLTLENVTDFAAQMMDNGWQVVFNLKSYRKYESQKQGEESGLDYGAIVVAALMNALMDYAEDYANGTRVACLVAIDEAHMLAPQSRDMSVLNDKTLATMKTALSSVATTGRSFGFTLVVLTQRIQNIAKWAISNLDNRVIMRHSTDLDLKRCVEELGMKSISEQDIRNLNKGEAYAMGKSFAAIPMLVKFQDRKSPHQSDTPTLEHAEKFYSGRTRKQFSAQMLNDFSQVFEEEDDEEQPTNVVALPARNETEVVDQRLNAEEQRVLNLLLNGASHRKVMDVTSFTSHKVSTIKTKLKVLGYVVGKEEAVGE